MMTTMAPTEVTCPSCESRFAVDPARVPESGILAVCSACFRAFAVTRPDGWVAAAPAWKDVEVEPEGRAHGVDDVEAQTPPTELEEPELEEAASGLDEFEAGESPALAIEVEGEEASTGLEDLEVEEAAPVEEEEPPFELRGEPAPEWSEDEPPGTMVEEVVRPGTGAEPAPEPTAAELPGVGADPSAPTAEGVSRFARRDPANRARRLARVLASDMITYNPARYADARRQGTLRVDFQDEIEKSWEEYVEQVGEELAYSTSHFVDALNDVLAQGEVLFRGPGRPW